MKNRYNKIRPKDLHCECYDVLITKKELKNQLWNNWCQNNLLRLLSNKDISNEIDVKNIDVLIVPAVAYDKNCYRLGYGGGYYDRFIERLRDDAITIGIAFDLQLFDSIPKEEHDAQLNYIITESSTYVGKNKNL